MAEKKESKSTLERVYTIPLRSAFRNAASHRKTNKAVKALREFLMKHMKSEDVRLGQHLNQFLWKHGIKNPPARVTVKAIKDEDGVVRAELEGKMFKESVRPIAKEEEPSSLKEKLVDKLGGKKDDDASPATPPANEGKAPKQSEKPEKSNPSAKSAKKQQADKPAVDVKGPSSKPESVTKKG